MSAGKPKDQSLAISFDIQRRNKRKKMAEGGSVTAKTEARPMPSERANDAKDVSQNASMKAASQDKVLDQPTVKQAMRPSITPLSRPKMANSIFKVRDRADIDKEEQMMASMPPASIEEQPDREYDEEEAKKSGTAPHPMKKMAEGGMINKAVSMKSSHEDEMVHPEDLEEDDDSMSPAQDEYMASRFAEGGEVEEDHHDSIVAAIMAKKARQMELDSDSEDDRAVDDTMGARDGIFTFPKKMAEGGEVDIDSNGEESPEDFTDRNEAALKENYDSDMDRVHEPMDSNEHGDMREDDEENKMDMISAIRSRMASRKQR